MWATLALAALLIAPTQDTADEPPLALRVNRAIARGVERVRADAQARVLLAQNLPALAAAVGERIGEVKITQFGGEALSPVTAAVERILKLASA